MKRLRILATLAALFVTHSVLAQSAADIFQNPGFGGTTQHSIWDLFTYAADSPNAPDYEGSVGTITQTGGNAIITSGGNIYSFSNDLRFVVAASSPQELGQVSFQIRTLGQEGAVLSMELHLDGGATVLQPTTSTEVYREEFGNEFGDSVDLGMAYTWDLSGRSVTSYEVVFELIIHASLDAAQLDTTTQGTSTGGSAPAITWSGIQNGSYALSFSSEAGQSYQVQWSDNLVNWNNLGNAVSGDGNVQTVSDPGALAQDRRFYRVILQ